jgi:hypothetical protein
MAQNVTNRPPAAARPAYRRVSSRNFSTTGTQAISWNGEEQPRTFQIKKSGYTTLLTGLLNPRGKETVLRLQHARVIAGKVIDKDTRQPISAFQVYHVRILQGPVTPSLSPRELVTGSSGAFKYSFADLLWPDDALYIEAEGYMPSLSQPLSGSDDGKELVFELTRARPVGGRVLTPQGTPADRAEIRLWCGELNLPDIPRQHETESDKDGAFAVPEIPQLLTQPSPKMSIFASRCLPNGVAQAQLATWEDGFSLIELVAKRCDGSRAVR